MTKVNKGEVRGVTKVNTGEVRGVTKVNKWEVTKVNKGEMRGVTKVNKWEMTKVNRGVRGVTEVRGSGSARGGDGVSGKIAPTLKNLGRRKIFFGR